MTQVDFFADDLLRGGRLAELEEITASNLDRRDANDLGDAVHVALHGEETLRRPESAKGSMRRRIRCQRLRSNAHTRPIIRTTGVNSATRQDHRGQRGVGAAIDGELD